MLDTKSGEHESINGDQRFHFNSTIKALACANVLEKVDKGQLTLNSRLSY
ncbi:serine hydrolase [Aeromonas media]